MKMFKKLGIIMVAFMFMFLGISSTYALNVIDSGLLAKEDGVTTFLQPVPGSTYNPYAWSILNTSDGRPAYCYDNNLYWPGSGGSITFSDPIDQTDAGLIYILEHGAANPSSPSNRERFITQGAIYVYQNVSLDGYVENAESTAIIDEINHLVSLARSTKYLVGDVAINSIDVSSSDMPLDGSYYVSDSIKPSIVGASNYTVSVSGVDGAEVVGNTTLNAGDSFKVRVPASAGVGKTLTVTVSISSKGKMVIPSDYNPSSDTAHQRIVYLDDTTKTITKSITLTTTTPKVCVDYKIVGSVKPDANLTDPTPDKKCFDKGTNYNQEKELTTKTDCKFKGWFTKDELTGKWVDGTALNNDMTLYGAWECPQTVDVPSTAASTSFMIVGIGLVIVAAGCGIYVFKVKKTN